MPQSAQLPPPRKPVHSTGTHPSTWSFMMHKGSHQLICQSHHISNVIVLLFRTCPITYGFTPCMTHIPDNDITHRCAHIYPNTVPLPNTHQSHTLWMEMLRLSLSHTHTLPVTSMETSNSTIFRTHSITPTIFLTMYTQIKTTNVHTDTEKLLMITNSIFKCSYS